MDVSERLYRQIFFWFREKYNFQTYVCYNLNFLNFLPQLKKMILDQISKFCLLCTILLKYFDDDFLKISRSYLKKPLTIGNSHI